MRCTVVETLLCENFFHTMVVFKEKSSKNSKIHPLGTVVICAYLSAIC